MNAKLWINRGAAVASLALTGLAVASAIAITSDVSTVQAAKTAAPQQARQRAPINDVTTLKPILKSDGAPEAIALGEFLNLRFSDLGLFVSAVDTVSLRTLGKGLKLAEMRVTATGTPTDLISVSNWVAVNREAVRMKSFTMASGADGRGSFTFILLLVVA